MTKIFSFAKFYLKGIESMKLPFDPEDLEQKNFMISSLTSTLSEENHIKPLD